MHPTEEDSLEIKLFEQLSSVLSHEVRSICCNIKSIYSLMEVDRAAVEEGKLEDFLPGLIDELDDRISLLIRMLDNTRDGRQLLNGLNDIRFALNN